MAIPSIEPRTSMTSTKPIPASCVRCPHCTIVVARHMADEQGRCTRRSCMAKYPRTEQATKPVPSPEQVTEPTPYTVPGVDCMYPEAPVVQPRIKPAVRSTPINHVPQVALEQVVPIEPQVESTEQPQYTPIPTDVVTDALTVLLDAAESVVKGMSPEQAVALLSQVTRYMLGTAEHQNRQRQAEQPMANKPEATVWRTTQAVYASLRAANPQLGGIVKVPDLTDAVMAAVQGLTPTAYHTMLMGWRQDGRLVLQLCNDRRLEPRAYEGIESPRGLLHYVYLRTE